MSRGRAYLLVFAAASLWGLNGVVSKVVLAHGIGADRLTQARITGAFAGLLAFMLASHPQALRATRRQAAYLVVFGALGLNGVQLFYALSIHRLPVGIAVLVEYTAPVLVALYTHFVLRHRLGRRVWPAAALVLAGLAVMLGVPGGGGGLSSAGLTFSGLAAVAYAMYILMVERLVGSRPPVATLTWGMGVAAAVWTVARPPWGFPWGQMAVGADLGGRLAGTSLPVGALVAWVVVMGTLVPFAMLVTALHALPATHVTLVATLEPVTGALIAWAWLAESLTVAQLAGAAIVLVGILVAESAAPLQIVH